VNAEPAKYAKPERERRFVLSEVPEGATDPREIVDLYASRAGSSRWPIDQP
jgi:hypothetical protein